PPEVQRIREANGLDVHYVALLRSLSARYPGLVVLDGRRAGYGDGQFSDFAHLNRAGAVVLSADVADLVARHLSGGGRSRWVPLPRFGPRAVTARVEDLEESKLSVIEEDRATRTR